MKSSKQPLRARISTLLQSSSISLPTPTPPNIQDSLTYKIQPLSPTQISESSLAGKIVGGVVQKNEEQKQLRLHLTTVYDNGKNVNFNISNNKFVAFIKDYELKADLSIFGYLNNFKDVQIGSYVQAWVRRIHKKDDQTLFQLHLNRQNDAKYPNMKLGVVKDNIKIPQSVLKVYEKQQTLPINFLIMYYPNYDNPGLVKNLQKNLKIQSLDSLHKVSNLTALNKLEYNYHRIRYIQQKTWRDEHLQLGIQCIRDKKYEDAVQCFNVSLRFGTELADTHIAKGCALVNMGNLSEGIRSIKEALKIDPYNQRAKKYYEQFQKELTYKKEDEAPNKKRFHSKNYDLIHK